VEIAKQVKPSDRGELEITDVNKSYLIKGQLSVEKVQKNVIWFDTGTISNLQKASCLMQRIEENHGLKVGCPEKSAFNNKYINKEIFQSLIKKIPECDYRDYLVKELISSVNKEIII